MINVKSGCAYVCVYARLLWKSVPWGVTASSRPGGQSVGRPYAASRLTLCGLQRGLNAHLTHLLPLWCNLVEVISFTRAFNFSQYRGGGGGGVDGSSVGGLGYVCLISLLLHKIKYDDQWKQQIELNVQALVFIYPLLA